MANIKASSAPTSSANIKELPPIPTWEVSWFEPWKDMLTTYEAAHVIQRCWKEWLGEVRAILEDLIDRMMEMSVPKADMADLIRNLAALEPRPSIHEPAASDDDFDSANKDMQSVYRSVVRAIRNSKQLVEDNRVEAGDLVPLFDRMKIAKPELEQHDLRLVFQKLLQEPNESEQVFDHRQQSLAFARVLSEACEEAERMADKEAEAVCNHIERLNI